MSALHRFLGFTAIASVVFVFWLALTSHKAPPPAPPRESSGVARVGNNVLTETAFIELLQQRGQRRPQSFDTREQRHTLVEEWVRAESIYAKALESGFDRRPDIAAAVRKLILNKFQEEQLSLRPAPAVSPQDIEAFYRQHAASFRTDEAVKGAFLLLRTSPKMTSEKLAQRRAEAEAIRQRALMGEDFGTLAVKYSEDQTTRYQGGLTAWLTRDKATSGGACVPEVGAALFAAVKPGEVTPLIETSNGIFIVKLLEQRPASAQPLSQVRDILRQQLMRAHEQDRQQAWFSEMKAGLSIEINGTLLESLVVPAANDKPPELPGPQTAQARTP
jgi:hypothetical protein